MDSLSTVWPYLRPYRTAYLFGLIAVVGANGFRTLVPRFLQHGIDAIATGAPRTELHRALLFLIAVALLGGACRYVMRQLLNSASRRVETDLRDALFAHLERQSATFFDRHTSGDLIARATNDLQNVRMGHSRTINAMLYSPAAPGESHVMVPVMGSITKDGGPVPASLPLA